MTDDLRTACVRAIDVGLGRQHRYYDLATLAHQIGRDVSRLPVSLRIVLESAIRHCDGRKVTERHVRELAGWLPNAPRVGEIPFVVGRVVLNCAAGIPLLGDLTAFRSATSALGGSATSIGPKVPIDMVLDHTLTVDFSSTPDALARNMALELGRNEERFRFVKWATEAFDGIRLFPPGMGILHQVNLEHLGRCILTHGEDIYPDSLVGTDSHTCMIAGLGVVGWGVGGIEAAASAMAHPYYMLMPDVVGINVIGALRPGVTSTDLVLFVTERLRQHKVVGKFVEFFGAGLANLTIPDRATIANMAPEYGATIGYFPIDDQTCHYLQTTGRSAEHVSAVRAYFQAQGCFGTPALGDIDYSNVFDLDLGEVVPCVAGPKRPQDRLPLPSLAGRFNEILTAPVAAGGYGCSLEPLQSTTGEAERRPAKHGDVVIAAITSCTNTSNPMVMIMAGLVARNAVALGLRPKPWVKASLTPGSRVVTAYLQAAGLQSALDALGFNVAGYACGTCVGASGPIDAALEADIASRDVVAAAVLSGNRNFEARIHPAVRAAFLASPPLVVAFALAGTVAIDFEHEPIGIGTEGQSVFLRDVWPSPSDLAAALALTEQPALYHAVYDGAVHRADSTWAAIPQSHGTIYPWGRQSTYLKEPPFLADHFRRSTLVDFSAARALAILGDSVTTDHISPIGNIKPASPAGQYLREHGVLPADFNNYGSRRMNHEVMVRGAFANVRLKNLMCPGIEGGITVHQPSDERLPIYDAAVRYGEQQVPLIVIAGEEYGTGSARDWAAKATRLLGVRIVVARSFERIHRSNLVGMGVLPCQFMPGDSAATWNLIGDETFDLRGLADDIEPRQSIKLSVHRRNGQIDEIPLILRLDTIVEVNIAKQGGIMPFLLSEVLTKH